MKSAFSSHGLIRVLAIATLVLFWLPSATRGQGDLIGSRGGLLGSTPLSGSASSLFNGFNLGGQSIQNGLGPIVSVLTQNGVHGQQLASIIHDLQSSRRLGDRDGDRFRDRDGDRDRFRDRDGDRSANRDIHEDRREVRDDERRLLNDQQRLARDREDLARDLHNRTGQFGNQLPPTVAGSTTPVLPSNLNLPAGVQSSLLKGLDSSGTATRHGKGWIVSDAAHQGVHGQELADVIHQLKPYKQQGVLTFPQNGGQQIFQQPQFQNGGEGGRFPSFGGGRGHGHGKGKG